MNTLTRAEESKAGPKRLLVQNRNGLQTLESASTEASGHSSSKRPHSDKPNIKASLRERLEEKIRALSDVGNSLPRPRRQASFLRPDYELRLSLGKDQPASSTTRRLMDDLKHSFGSSRRTAGPVKKKSSPLESLLTRTVCTQRLSTVITPQHCRSKGSVAFTYF